MQSSELIRRIRRAGSADEALRVAEGDGKLESLTQCACAFAQRRGVTLAALAREIDMERTALYRIVKQGRPTSRNVLLRMAFALGLSVEDAQKLLKCGRRCALSPRDRRDALLLYCLQRSLTLTEAEALLQEMKEISMYARG